MSARSLTEDALAVVTRLFVDGDRAAAVRLLETECGNNLPGLESVDAAVLDRFRFAAVKVSGGSLALLRDAVALGKVDWRDLLVQAGFANDLQAHRAWHRWIMSGRSTAADDIASPEARVAAFIRAMHAWELASWDASRKARGAPDPASYRPGVEAALDRVFAEFCAAPGVPEGRAASFQRPPGYDPALERIAGCDAAADRASVETERDALLGGGRRRYRLVRTGGRWRIDGADERRRDGWAAAML